MDEPTLADYVKVMYTLFEKFKQTDAALNDKEQRDEYGSETLRVFFMVMQYRRVFQFKTQWRWLNKHRLERELIGLGQVPDRSTLSRRYQQLYGVLQAFIQFTGQYAEALDTAFESQHLDEDKSLFKAHGPVWHESDRQAGRVPEKLRHWETDATWSKSGYHGWVYGYALHLTCNRLGFPKLVQVGTAAVSEKQVMHDKAHLLLNVLQPQTVTGDNGYAQVKRIRAWARSGLLLLTPAVKWTTGKYAKAYHALMRFPDYACRLRPRRTAIEPFFDLCAQTVGTLNNHQQLPLQRLVNVRTGLALAVLSLHVARLANSSWLLPLRAISAIRAAFS